MSDDAQKVDELFEQFAAVAIPEVEEPRESPSADCQPQSPSSLQSSHSPLQPALYDRLGALVRQLHDALRALGYEQVLDDTLREITDSQDRLQYIASLTEQAANRVLNAVDEALPIQTEQAFQARQLEQAWSEWLHLAAVENPALLALIEQSHIFMTTVALSSEDEKKRLMDIMMAQDFQDITGQIIKKVVNLTQKLETELAQILREYAPAGIVKTEKPVDLMAGPSVPDVAMVQNDVDSMLAELGF